MLQYDKRIKEILSHGNKRTDRTGTGTVSMFGVLDRYHMLAGFPLYGNRRVSLKWIYEELNWILRGDSNIKSLQAKGVTIWDEWALTEEHTHVMENFNEIKFMRESLAFDLSVQTPSLGTCSFAELQEYFDKCGVDIEEYLIARTGDIGPMYPTLWRNFNGVDQIQQVIQSIIHKPYSRRHCVSAWHPTFVPDESISPEENVIEGKGALSTCHHFFQFYVRDLTIQERTLVSYGPTEAQRLIISGEFMGLKDKTGEELDGLGIPTKGLSLKLSQRSADYILGAPYNIASYSLLLHMVAKIVGMQPWEFIHDIGDCHIYLNHLDKIEEMIERPKPDLPILTFEGVMTDTYTDPVEFTWKDIKLTGYNPGPTMQFDISK